MTDPASDGWTPEFPGQRPPWEPGNSAALTAGHRSERHVGPLADQIEADLLAMPDLPPYLREPTYRAAVRAYCRAEACVTLLTDWLSERDITAALAETEETEETEDRTKNSTTRRGTSKRVQSALDALHKHETRAASLRSRLGLDPASRARIGRDLSQSRFYANATPLDDAIAEIQRRRELTAGSNDG